MDEPGKAIRRHSRGDGLSSPWVGPEHGDNRVFIAFANKVPCGRPAGAPIRLSSPDQPMDELVGINGLAPALLASYSLTNLFTFPPNINSFSSSEILRRCTRRTLSAGQP